MLDLESSERDSDAELIGKDRKKDKNMHKKEMRVLQEEFKKRKVIDYFLKRLGDNIQQDQIFDEDWLSRQTRAPPRSLNDLNEVLVVQDDWEQFPSLVRMMYASLDYSLVMLYALLFILFQEWLGFNAPLAIFCVYLLERCLRYMRSSYGNANLSTKSYVDQCFFK